MSRIIYTWSLCTITATFLTCDHPDPQITHENSPQDSVSKSQTEVVVSGVADSVRSQRFESWVSDTLQILKKASSVDATIGLVSRTIERPSNEVLVIWMTYRHPVSEIPSMPVGSRLRTMLDFLVRNHEVVRPDQVMRLAEEYSYGLAYAASEPLREVRSSVDDLELVGTDSTIVFDVIRGRLNSRTARVP